jgi:hypothetical protein
MITMKTGVKTSYLWHVGQPIEDCLDRGQIMRLMQRRQRDQFIQLRQYFFVQNGWGSEERAAMNHAMAYAQNARACKP